MNQSNPYALEHMIAAEAPADARAQFIQKTYGFLLAGVLVFVATLWAAGNVASVRELAVGLYRMNPWLSFAIVLGGSWLVHAVAEKSPINVVAYFTYAFLFGLLLAPIVLVAANTAPVVLTQASILTAFVFTGMTAWAFLSKKDFSFLGGILSIAFFGMLGVAIAGMIFGFTIGLWYSVIGVIVFAGYILYDTSRILHHYGTHQHITAAIVLFTDVVLLFKHILVLLMRSRD
jgi:FtsH-binding integral membrane protein